MKPQLLVVTLTLLILRISCQQQLYSTKVTSTPSDVSEKDTKLILQVQPINAIPQWAVVELKIPKDQVSFTKAAISNAPKCEYQGESTPQTTKCQISADGSSITWNLPQAISESSQFLLSTENGFNNPVTSEPTRTWVMSIYADSSKTKRLDYQNSDLKMNSSVILLKDDESQMKPNCAFGTCFEVSKPTRVELEMVMKTNMPPGAVIIVDFPIYNPQARDSLQHSYFVNAADVYCESIEVAHESLSCSVQRLRVGFAQPIDRLTIIDSMPEGAKKDQKFLIEIDRIYNPLSMHPRSFAISVALVKDINGEVYNIQEGFTKFSASLPTTISNIQITTLDATVQEYTEFTIQFQPDVEIEKGAFVVIQFPTGTEDDKPFIFDNNLNSMKQIGGMYSRIDNAKFIYDSVSNKIETKEGTVEWTNIGVTRITLSKIQNPDHADTYGTFKISVLDQYKKLIATRTSGLTYTTIPGSIRDVKITPYSLFIDEQARLAFEFVPLHNIPKDAKIMLKFTKDIIITCPEMKDSLAFGYNSKQLTSPLNMTCIEANAAEKYTQIMINNPLQEAYIHDDPAAVKEGRYGSDAIIKVVFTKALNALSAREIKGLEIQTITAGGNLIDTYNSEDKVWYTLLAKPINGAQINVNTDETFTAATFTFVLTLANKILPGSFVEIALPPEVKLVNNETPKIVAGSNFDAVHSQVQTTIDSFGGVTLRVFNFITEEMGMVGINEQVSFGISSLLTPLSTLSSTSFKIYTKDIKERLVNYIENDLFVTMRKGKHIPTFQIEVLNSTVGAITKHMIAFDTVVPITTENVIQLIYPQQARPPIGKSPVCVGKASFADAITCEVVQDIVTIKNLKFRGNISTTLSVGSRVSFSIENCLNPYSAKPTDAFKLYIKDSKGSVISELSNPNFQAAKIIMDTPATITEYKFKATDERQLAKTAFQLSFTSTMPYPSGSYITIKLDPEILGPESSNGETAEVECFSNLQLQTECAFTDPNILRIDGMVIDSIRPHTHIELQIANFQIFVDEPMVTQSWEVLVYTSDGYFIEGRSKGISLEFKCAAPCLTCKNGEPNSCTSCNSLTGQTILYQQQCLNRCPATTFYDDSSYGCKKCNSNCLTCAYTNGNECTSCNPKSKFPYLDGTVCKSECPFGTYEDSVTNQCEPCQSPCQSCNTGPLDCNTCDIKSPERYLQVDRCLKACEPGWAVPSDNLDFVCQKCSSNCETCAGELDFCLTCKSSSLAPILNKLDNNCVKTCPAKLTIETFVERPVCLTCTGKCKTCKGTTDFCSSCTSGFILDESVGECIKECSTDDTRVEQNGKCVNCQSPCKTCDGEPNKCLTCDKGLYMHDYSCVKKCPDQYEAREDGRCVLTGFFCRFGYDYNAAGNGCILKAQICEGYDILNYDKTKCIPMPGVLVPFPLLFIACICGLIIFVSKKKYPATRFYPSMICVLSVLESIGLFSLVALSSSYGIRPAFSLSFCALAFLLGLNMFAALVYFKQIKRDIVFKYWEQEFPLTSLAVVSTSFLLNFKVYRAFYSRFRDRKDLNAVFQDQSIFYRSVIFGSALYLLVGTLPIVVASCFGIWYIPFGYQVQMFCLEMIIIEALLLMCMGLELFKISKHILSPQYQKLRSEKGNAYKVAPLDYSTAAESEESTLLRKLLHTITSKDAGKREYTTVAEIRELHEQEIRKRQLRRCYSFKEIRDFEDEKDPMHLLLAESDSDNGYNFISEPSSPRSKEMLLNFNFHSRMNELSKAYRMRDHYDNCYHEAKPLFMFDYKNTVMVERTVQTNVLELLGVDDLLPSESNLRNQINNPDPAAVKIGEQSVDEENDLGEAAAGFGQDLIGKVLGQFEGFQQHKKRKRLPPARVRALPNFAINDIIGEFDVDEQGNFIIVSNGYDQLGRVVLEDAQGRRVNKRGYLLDNLGHVITKDGQLVFRPNELDSDDEIPAPFCYLKHKETLGLKSDAPPNLNGIVLEQDEEDELIEREFRKLKQNNNLQEESVEEADVAPSKFVQFGQNKQDFFNPNNEDLFERIVQPMKPKARNEINPQAATKSKQNQDLISISPEIEQKLMPEQVDDISKRSSPVRQLNPSGLERMDQHNVELARRPVSGATASVNAFQQQKKQQVKKVVAARDTTPKSSIILPAYKRDTEQEIIEGIEKFQAMLARYPIRPKSSRASNTLANKKLQQVYGKVKEKFNRNIHLDDNQIVEKTFPTIQSPIASGKSMPIAAALTSFQVQRNSEQNVSITAAIKNTEKMKNLHELYSQSRSFKSNSNKAPSRKIISANSASQKVLGRKIEPLQESFNNE